ncbi:MAG: hypothetical protein LBU72_06835 [Burkholderiaceae bacterium]|nr:hypothetical protein [Burkholderiaceae bacterium]
MSRPLHWAVPARYGAGASMIFGLADDDCGPPIDAYYNLAPQPMGANNRDGAAPQAVAASSQAQTRRKARRKRVRRARPAATQTAPASAPLTSKS